MPPVWTRYLPKGPQDRLCSPVAMSVVGAEVPVKRKEGSVHQFVESELHGEN